MRAPILVVVVFSGCVSFVGNQPRLLLVKQEYGEGALRGAIISAFEHRKIATLGEEEKRIWGESSRQVTCGFSVEFTETQAQLVTTGPTATDDASKIDKRCDEEAARLVKTIEGELTRPERVARKADKLRARQDAVNARNAAYAAAAQQYAAQQQVAAQQYADQQAALQAQQQASMQQQGYVAETPVAASAPAPVQNNTFTTNNVQSNTSIQTNTTINTTNVTNNSAPAASEPRLQPNTCCVQGRAYLCPNTTVYAAACVQHQGNLASSCPPASAHDRFCPR